MNATDELRRTLYVAFAAYSGCVGVREVEEVSRKTAEAVTTLDGIFESVVGSMNEETRELFVKSLRDGSSAFQVIDGLLHNQEKLKGRGNIMVEGSMAKGESTLSQPEMDQARIESEVISVLYQLPRGKVFSHVPVPIKVENIMDEKSPSSTVSRGRKRSPETISVTEGKMELETLTMEEKEMEAAHTLVQSHKGTGNRSRKYSHPVPSEHCHVCCRPTRKLRFVVCKNIQRSMCRKVICVKCFESFQWNWESAIAKNSTWTCTHCRDVCPQRAQCFVYERINSRRKKRNKEIVPPGLSSVSQHPPEPPSTENGSGTDHGESSKSTAPRSTDDERGNR